MAKGKYAKQEIKKPFYKKWWFIALVVVILMGAFGNTEDTEAPTEPTKAVETTQPATTESMTTETDPVENEEEPLELKFGELLDVTINSIDNIAVIKAKIQPSYSNSATIHQNYYSVCDLIQNHGFDQYKEVQYWAVADMTDGSEQKVISFTVDADLMALITSDSGFAENTLGEYDIDLWIHPSLEDN